MLLPALSSVVLKRPLKKRPPGKTTPPSINHSNYKDEKDKQRKKERGGWSQIERQDENTGRQTEEKLAH